MTDLLFFIEVLVGGLLSGIMYALVALGFVLIYKASSVFNFAQGSMVFFAVLSLVGFMELGLPLWAAIPVAIGLMVLVGMATERFVLRPLVSQSEDMVTALALLFSRTKVGRGLRAVADDHTAALSIGIPLKHIWMLVWATAGVVALVAGMLWGARSGVQFALVWVALKALPVLIIGGFTSVPGVIVAGLLVGAIEKVTEVYIGPFVGGGIEGWSPYMLAVLFLLIRPEGLFGEKIIRRV